MTGEAACESDLSPSQEGGRTSMLDRYTGQSVTLDEVLCWSESYTDQSVRLVRALRWTKCYGGWSDILVRVSYLSKCYLALSEHCHARVGPLNVTSHESQAKGEMDER